MAQNIDIPNVEAPTNYSLGSDQPGTHALMEYSGSFYAYKGGNIYRMEPAPNTTFSDAGIPKTADVYENEPFPVEDILKRDDVPDAFKVGLMRVRELADDGLLVVLERDKLKLEPKQEPAPAPAPEEPDTVPTANSFSIDKDGNIDTNGMSPDELELLQERMKDPSFQTIVQDAKDACKHSGEQTVNIDIYPGNANTDYGPGPVGVVTIPPSVSISSPNGETLISYPTGFGHSFDHYVTPDWMDQDLPRFDTRDRFKDVNPEDFIIKTDTPEETPDSLLSRTTEIDGPSDYLRDLDPEKVKVIQELLKDNGSDIAPDGKWGQKTMQAYQQYIQDNDISHDTGFDQLYADVKADNWKDKANHYATAAAKLPPETLNAPFAGAGGEAHTAASPERTIDIAANNGVSTQTITPT